MNAVTSGIKRLSFIWTVENSSTAVAVETAIRLIIKNAGDKLKTTKNATMKKAEDPSNDLLNK